ncbi:hypothetical protein ACYFX5_17155 [Bremerella sp. T1]|uniref:hypothetical protein n=1 Tax=Bremerella sp. TYQ1 TaxID=3119568 RepID=UPI001CCFAD42|nr:hypothetical protein [Bremerella volcania]UBM34787.1 hypothetical protein LA756_19105 [Bremerella volcania]
MNKRGKIKRPILWLFMYIFGLFTVSAAFIDYGLPNAGPNAPGQGIWSLIVGVALLAGLPQIYYHFFGSEQDNSGDWSGD